MDTELKMHFPAKFSDAEDMEFYYNLQKRLEADLDAMIDPAKEPDAVAVRLQTDEYFAILNKPRNFGNEPGGFVVMQDGQFEDLICVLEDNGTPNAKNLTTYEFFKRADYCERKFTSKNPD